MTVGWYKIIYSTGVLGFVWVFWRVRRDFVFGWEFFLILKLWQVTLWLGTFFTSGNISISMCTAISLNSIHLDFGISSVRILTEEASCKRYQIWCNREKTLILKTRWTKPYTGISKTQHFSDVLFELAFCLGFF